jgi:TonB family protein
MIRPAIAIASLLFTGLVVAAPDTAKLDPRLPTGKLVRPDAVRVTGKQAERFRLRRGDTAAEHYPEAARKAAVDGKVVVDLLLNEGGQVLEAQIVAESPQGFDLGIAALDLAKTFEYVNPLKRLVLMSITVEFVP